MRRERITRSILIGVLAMFGACLKIWKYEADADIIVGQRVLGRFGLGVRRSGGGVNGYSWRAA